ncbi:hypothetical protein JXA32_14270, partial [Candidatus Sumerlaeota bacterium]|nr:hypothetical protein [Candidatus Sumerlaeota bacterium]
VLVFENTRNGELVEINEVELSDEALIETKREIDQLLASTPAPEPDGDARQRIADEELAAEPE